MSRLENLYARKFRIQGLIERAIQNGENRKRIERLDRTLEDIEYEIDKENMRLYGHGEMM